MANTAPSRSHLAFGLLLALLGSTCAGHMSEAAADTSGGSGGSGSGGSGPGGAGGASGGPSCFAIACSNGLSVQSEDVFANFDPLPETNFKACRNTECYDGTVSYGGYQLQVSFASGTATLTLVSQTPTSMSPYDRRVWQFEWHVDSAADYRDGDHYTVDSYPSGRLVDVIAVYDRLQLGTEPSCGSCLVGRAEYSDAGSPDGSAGQAGAGGEAGAQ